MKCCIDWVWLDISAKLTKADNENVQLANVIKRICAKRKRLLAEEMLEIARKIFFFFSHNTYNCYSFPNVKIRKEILLTTAICQINGWFKPSGGQHRHTDTQTHAHALKKKKMLTAEKTGRITLSELCVYNLFTSDEFVLFQFYIAVRVGCKFCQIEKFATKSCPRDGIPFIIGPIHSCECFCPIFGWNWYDRRIRIRRMSFSLPYQWKWPITMCTIISPKFIRCQWSRWAQTFQWAKHRWIHIFVMWPKRRMWKLQRSHW